MVPWILLFAGCLERVTGEDVPLDPRFTAGMSDTDKQPSDPNAGGTGDGAYVGYDGETWHLAGTVRSTTPGAVQIDVNEPDAAAQGGQRRAGAIHLNQPGTFEIDVPATVTSLRLQAFQDPSFDGPDEKDPFAEATVVAADEATVELVLVKGARGVAGAPSGPGGGVPGPGGGPGDAPGGQPGVPGPPPSGLTFPEGPMVTLSGTVAVARDLPVVLDFFHADGQGQGGRTYLGRRIVQAGEFSQSVPANYGAMEIEAYQDLTGDSRTGDDPAARLAQPVIIAGDDVDGVSLAIP